MCKLSSYFRTQKAEEQGYLLIHVGGGTLYLPRSARWFRLTRKEPCPPNPGSVTFPAPRSDSLDRPPAGLKAPYDCLQREPSLHPLVAKSIYTHVPTPTRRSKIPLLETLEEFTLESIKALRKASPNSLKNPPRLEQQRDGPEGALPCRCAHTGISVSEPFCA